MNFTFPIIVPKNVEVVVASFGGVGTTFLMDYIAQYKKTNFPCDRDLLKHSPFPPISYNKNIRFLYIYGDPLLATISLFRRQYHHWQIEKLNRYSSNNSIISSEMSLEEYAAAKVDRFQFSTHFHNWYSNYLAHPTMFIRYENLFDCVEPLVDFLGLPSSAVDNFPIQKERKSLVEEINSETIHNLTEIYGSFANEIKNLSSVEIRRPEANKSLSKTYLSSPYPQIMFNNMLDFKMLARNNSFTTYKEFKRVKQIILNKKGNSS